MALPKNKIVGVSMFATAAIVVVGGASRGEFPGPRQFIALAIVYIVLGFGAEIAPALAGPMAVLVFVAVLMTNGQALDAISGIGARARTRPISKAKRRRLAQDPTPGPAPGR